MYRAVCIVVWLTALGWAPRVWSQAAQRERVSYDPATNTVTFALEAGAPGTVGPFNFDGYTNGAATLVVPRRAPS
jgi:hypothetical protein